MFRLQFLLLHAFILQFIPHRLFRWFVSCLCAPTAQTLRTGLVGNNSRVGLTTEGPINEILIARIINAAAQRSSFTCDLRPRTKCSYCLPNLSQQFLLPAFSYAVFGQERRIWESLHNSRTDHFPKENEQIQLEGTKLSHKFSFHPQIGTHTDGAILRLWKKSRSLLSYHSLSACLKIINYYVFFKRKQIVSTSSEVAPLVIFHADTGWLKTDTNYSSHSLQ